MKLEDQVCSLELAKRLKELGVKQDSLFYWWYFWDATQAKPNWFLLEDEKDDKVNEKVSAFTVAELGEMLPLGCSSFKINPDWPGYANGKEWACEYSDEQESQYGGNEADARAKCLIYLIENGLVKP